MRMAGLHYISLRNGSMYVAGTTTARLLMVIQSTLQPQTHDLGTTIWFKVLNQLSPANNR